MHYVSATGEYTPVTKLYHAQRVGKRNTPLSKSTLMSMALTRGDHDMMTRSALIIVEYRKNFHVIKSRYERDRISGAVEFLKPYLSYYIRRYINNPQP